MSRLEESTTNNLHLALFFSSHYGAFGCCRGDSYSSVFNMLKDKYSNYSWFTTFCWFSHILIPSGPNLSWKQDVHLVVYYRCRSLSLLGAQRKMLLVSWRLCTPLQLCGIAKNAIQGASTFHQPKWDLLLLNLLLFILEFFFKIQSIKPFWLYHCLSWLLDHALKPSGWKQLGYDIRLAATI